MSGKSVKTFLPSPSSAATFSAAAIAAPDEIPARKPSWLPNERDVAIASSEGIRTTLSDDFVSNLSGMKPVEIPWILCGPGLSPFKTADSSASIP